MEGPLLQIRSHLTVDKKNNDWCNNKPQTGYPVYDRNLGLYSKCKKPMQKTAEMNKRVRPSKSWVKNLQNVETLYYGHFGSKTFWPLFAVI